MKLLPLLILASCAVDPVDDDPIDSDAPFDIGKADGTSCLPSLESDDARGLLALANDPAVTADELDDLGIYRRTAHAIVDARPFADLGELDAVPNVGPYVCRVMRARACDVDGRCERALGMWTWNIEHFPLTDGAIDAVAQTLTDARPEIVGFEEVDSIAAFDQLLAKLPGWQGLVGLTGFDTRVAIAFRGDRLKMVAKEDLFPNDSRRFPRPPLAVTFEATGRAGTLRFVVVTVHLKAEIDLDSRERRRQAIVALDQWLAGKRAEGIGVIVVGDWNDDIDAPADRNVFLPLLGNPEAYATPTVDIAHRGGYSYIPFKRLIDHIVMTREAATAMPLVAIDPVALDATIPNYARAVSDHRPVRADVMPIIPAAGAAKL